MGKPVQLSVIVPVYNVEKYLRQCLDSLIKQTLDSIEIIIVNDGSTDSCQDIIEEYQEKFSTKIRSFSKQNVGLGSARNFGLEMATGKYVGFVDSDDWVSHDMFQKMLGKALTGYDVVFCDMFTVNDGDTTGEVSKSFRGQKFNKREIMLNCINPAISCNKIYKKELFNIVRFPRGWYEDIATTPILLSYADQIGYIEEPLYYYRQRLNSITNTEDPRIMDVLEAWERVLQNVNGEYLQETIYAITYSIISFMESKPNYADAFLSFTASHKREIEQNPYYIKDVQKNRIIDIVNMKLIPKKIHYFWFGHGKKSDLIHQCIRSWNKYANDYEIIEWNETNCNINENQFVKEAYNAKKWAFVADYFRLKVIYEHGGFYLDTDTELTNKIDDLRFNNACFAFETRDAVHAGIFGAVSKHALIRKWLDTYQNQHFQENDGTYNTSETIVVRLTRILKKDYKIKLNGKAQVLMDNVKVYPANILTIDVYDGENIAIHHYDASWWDVKDGISYKNVVLRDYFTNPAIILKNYKMTKLAPIYRKVKRYFNNKNNVVGKIGGSALLYLSKLIK